MIDVCGKTITMDEGDYGLPITFNFVGDLSDITKAEMIVKKDIEDEEIILLKDVTPSGQQAVFLDFTKEESELLPEGKYYWGVKLYAGDNVLNTIISGSSLIIRRCV